MSFSTIGLETADKVGKYLTYGINHCKIVGMSVMTAGTGSKKVRFQMEGAPEKAGFEGVDGAKGKVGRVDSSYMKEDKAFTIFMTQIGVIADKLGVRTEVDAIKAGTIEEYIALIEPLLKGKPAWWMFGGEEYEAGRFKLNLLRFGFIKSESEVDASSLKMDGYSGVELRTQDGKIALLFSKDNKFHYQPLSKSVNGADAPSASAGVLKFGQSNQVDDLPFGNPSSADTKTPFDQDAVDDLPFSN